MSLTITRCLSLLLIGLFCQNSFATGKRKHDEAAAAAEPVQVDAAERELLNKIKDMKPPSHQKAVREAYERVEDKAAFAHFMLRIFALVPSKSAHGKFIMELAKIDPVDYDRFIAFVTPFLEKEKRKGFKDKLLLEAATIEPTDWEDFGVFAQAFARPHIITKETIEELARVPPADRAAILSDLQKITLKTGLTELPKEFPLSNRESFLRILRKAGVAKDSLIEQTTTFLTSLPVKLSYADRVDVMSHIADIVPEQREDFLRQIPRINAKSNGLYPALFWHFQRLDEEKKESFAQVLSVLPPACIDYGSLGELLKVEPQNAAVFNEAIRIIPLDYARKFFWSTIMRALVMKPVDDWINFATFIRDAAPDNQFPDALARVPIGKRGEFIDIMTRLDRVIDRENKSRFIARVGLSQFVARAQRFLRQPWAIGAPTPADRLRILTIFLETPLNEPIIAHDQPGNHMARAAAAGARAVNVHARQREIATVHAAKLFKDYIRSANPSKAAVQEAYDKLREKLKKAYADRSNRITLSLVFGATPTDGFGGLLLNRDKSKHMVTDSGINMTGHQLLSYLAYFGENYEAPGKSEQEILAERENILDGFVNALLDCAPQGKVLCDHGKLQRLLLVLQGRLPGINIDDLPAELFKENCSADSGVTFDKKSPEELSSLFLIEQQQVTSAAQLRALLEEFITAHPEISAEKKIPLRELIEDYIRLQELH